eukprot:CAMPEP_0194034352 /NCGR_PEP_ID=MMETSP0009_2-20130614/6759_1 /TAXON_ID=210454 /ORGANISM="Grammatophora oceanica, Strain CCMP 410" /LENGTH=98 /DNA_ID=CAMNT_0038675229 /DNA_START=333 /DNA_END=629 /DNA_ORIENTATION=+
MTMQRSLMASDFSPKHMIPMADSVAVPSADHTAYAILTSILARQVPNDNKLATYIDSDTRSFVPDFCLCAMAMRVVATISVLIENVSAIQHRTVDSPM